MPLPRPSQLTYNDLNGEEALGILCDQFRALLERHHLMQRHLTLPMAKIRLDVSVNIDMYMGGLVPVESPPERVTIAGTLKIDHEVSGHAVDDTAGMRSFHDVFSSGVSAAPIAGGSPPDKVRADHGLPVTRPGYGPRDTGSHMFLSNQPEAPLKTPSQQPQFAPPPSSLPPGSMLAQPDRTGGRQGEVAPGYTFSPVVVTPDQPASSLEQHLPVDQGEISIHLGGGRVAHDSGVTIGVSHQASVKKQGDGRGSKYGSVNGVYDAGPRGLMQHGGGYGSDGRPRISFGNNHRG
jgi:hypothetical protein